MVDRYLFIALLGQMLGGLLMAVGLIVGLRLALPSLARTLARELEAARAMASEVRGAESRPVVTLRQDG